MLAIIKRQVRLNIRTALVLGHDAVASVLAWAIAYWFRFNFDLSPSVWTDISLTLVWVVPTQAVIFWALGLYQGIWRYASLPDLKRILFAVSLTALAVPLIVIMFRVQTPVPRSVLLLDPILLIVMMSGSRFMYRLWKEHRLYGLVSKRGESVLVLGAGDAAVMLVKELMRSDQWQVAGLLDDDRAKHGRLLHGIKVLGTLNELQHWADTLSVRHVIIAMPSATQAALRNAVSLCSSAKLTVLTVPSYQDLVSGRVTISQVRRVEVEDLLGRDPVMLDNAGLHGFLTGQVIMVTGAGGSIGSELCRQIASYKPSLLVLFELNEFALYSLHEEFAETIPDVPIIAAIGDAKNRLRVRQVIQTHSPQVIFHAAAYKHVPLMEEVNSWEAIRNNVFGTYTVAEEAIANKVRKFVLISTDKAINPTNVMGASKRLAEIVCQALQRATTTTYFEMVRFGNVLGSTGSVIPKFHDQITKGGPITVTHPDIIRYFMSIPEAAQLVLQAGCMGRGGEIFVMDMGEPIRIADLARDMIRLAGYSEGDIGIIYTGLRPGEKLYEELLADNEQTRPSDHPKLRIAKASNPDKLDLAYLLTWLEQQRDLPDDEVRRDLKRWVPEYTSSIKPQLRVIASNGGR